jgi:hypothetical protein
MTSRAGYTFSVQPLFDVVPCFAVRPFVEAFQALFANDESSTVSERLRPRPEDAVRDRPVETFNELWRARDRNGLSIAAHTFT